MLFFIDESWQQTARGDVKVGVLAAFQVKAHDFNEFSRHIYQLKATHIGPPAGNTEIKGKHIFRDYLFNLEQKGIKSNELNLARSIFGYLKSLGSNLFASVVIAEEEIDLSCADENKLERPFFFLFERINLFMEENHPGLMASIIFDDRGVQQNRNIATSVSNFFHKSQVGQSFDSIIKVPTFAISDSNVGVQIADMVAYILGNKMTGQNKTKEFEMQAKELQFKSRKKYMVDGKEYSLFGFKTIKDKNKKEAGDLFDPGRI